MANCKMINGWPYSVMVSSSPDNFAIFFNGQSGCRQYTVAQRFHGASTNIHWTECCEKKTCRMSSNKGILNRFLNHSISPKTPKPLKIRGFAMMRLLFSLKLRFFGGSCRSKPVKSSKRPRWSMWKKSSPPPQKSKTFGVGKKNPGKHGNAHVVKGNTCSKRHLKKVQVSPVINSYTAIFLFQVFFLNYILPVRIISFQLNPVVLKLTNVGAAHEQ